MSKPESRRRRRNRGRKMQRYYCSTFFGIATTRRERKVKREARNAFAQSRALMMLGQLDQRSTIRVIFGSRESISRIIKAEF